MKKLFIIILILFTLVSCTPQDQSWWNSDLKWEVGKVPVDVCIENGKPVIYGMTSESDGDVSLVYLRNDGAVVLKHYPMDLGGLNWKEGGEFYFSTSVDGCKED